MVQRVAVPIDTAEELLFHQDQWVTADIPALYEHLKPMVHFTIEPGEGLLAVEFNPLDKGELENILKRFGCELLPVQEDEKKVKGTASASHAKPGTRW